MLPDDLPYGRAAKPRHPIPGEAGPRDRGVIPCKSAPWERRSCVPALCGIARHSASAGTVTRPDRLSVRLRRRAAPWPHLSLRPPAFAARVGFERAFARSSKPPRKSETESPKVPANITRTCSVRFLEPFSAEPIYVRWTPARSANSSCDHFRCSRSSRMRWPTASCSAGSVFLRFRSCTASQTVQSFPCSPQTSIRLTSVS